MAVTGAVMRKLLHIVFASGNPVRLSTRHFLNIRLFVLDFQDGVYK